MPDGKFLEGVPHEALVRGRLHSGRFWLAEQKGLGETGHENTTSTLEDYFEEFKDLNPEENLIKNQPISMLELMGSGGAFNREGFEGVAVTLHDFRIDKSNPRVKVLKKNILLPEAWMMIGEWLKEKGLPGFDLILCTPEYKGFQSLGFFEGILGDENVGLSLVQQQKAKLQLGGLYFGIMNEAYKRLNEKGMMLFQWPDQESGIFPSHYLNQWYENEKQREYPLVMEMADGAVINKRARIRVTDFLVKIVKNPGSPAELYNNPYLHEAR